MTWTLRPATSEDTEAVARIMTGFQETTPWMPKLHTHAGNVRFCARIIDEGGVIVRCCGDAIAGFLNLDGTEIDHLYLAPEFQRQGLGRLFVDHAKAQADRLELWTFQANMDAQAFYERLGFRVEKRTDGAASQEKIPDIRYVWTRS